MTESGALATTSGLPVLAEVVEGGAPSALPSDPIEFCEGLKALARSYRQKEKDAWAEWREMGRWGAHAALHPELWNDRYDGVTDYFQVELVPILGTSLSMFYRAKGLVEQLPDADLSNIRPAGGYIAANIARRLGSPSPAQQQEIAEAARTMTTEDLKEWGNQLLGAEGAAETDKITLRGPGDTIREIDEGLVAILGTQWALDEELKTPLDFMLYAVALTRTNLGV